MRDSKRPESERAREHGSERERDSMRVRKREHESETSERERERDRVCESRDWNSVWERGPWMGVV